MRKIIKFQYSPDFHPTWLHDSGLRLDTRDRQIVVYLT